jgi:hypothetical protein
MSDDILLIGDGEIQFLDLEASADAGRKPRIRTSPAYSGGKLDVAWTHPETKERLPVVVDLETLEAGAGLPFVLYHDLKQPLGTIDKITKTSSELHAEGPLTHGHTLYGAQELTAARNGFKHRPSVTVYRPEPKHVLRVGDGERRLINGRTQEGPFFAVYHGKLRNISMESTPGDPACDARGSILAQSKGVQTMEPNLFQQANPADGAPTPQAPQDIAAQAAPAVPPTPPAPATSPAPAQPNIEAGANPVSPAPAVHTASPSDLNRDMISKMYDRGDISPDIMAQAFDQHWTPKQALDAQGKINGLANGVGGAPNIAGFPNMPNHDRSEPNGDMIMAAAFLMEHCGFKPGDFDGKTNKDSVLRLDERTIDAATSGDLRGIRFSDLCAHAANAYYEPRTAARRRLASKKPLEYFAACVKAQPHIDEKLDFDHVEDIRASADTGLSTIGLQNIWAVINTATIGKGYQEIPTVWQKICKQASVPNFLTHTVHRTQLVGEFQRLNRIGAEPPHATYKEDMTEGKIDEWGLMLTLSRKDIVNDAVGIFTSAAADLGREAARTLERECFAALLSDGAQLFRTQHRNLLTGADSAFGFDALDKAFTLFRQQKGMNGEPIMVRPSFLLLPSSLYITAMRLLSMGTTDGSPLGKITGYQNFPIVESQYLTAENGLYVMEGSKRERVPGNDAGWYLFADPNILPVVVATFLNGRTRPTIQRANMRFSLDGIQYKAIMDFEFLTSEFRGGVFSRGA